MKLKYKEGTFAHLSTFSIILFEKEANEIVKATADITNKYGNSGKFKILVAFYDANNKMLGCEEAADGTFTFYDIEKEVSGFTTVKVPAGTEKIKAFMWEDTENIIPQYSSFT